MANAAYTCVLAVANNESAPSTGAATTMLAANEYQISIALRRIISPDTAIVVYDNAVAQADADVTINYLFGKIKKVSGNFTGPVTIDYAYMPVVNFAEVRSFEINMSREVHDSTVMASATAVRAKTPGLKDASGTIGSLEPLTTDLSGGGVTISVFADWNAGTKRVLEVTFPSGLIWRAFVKFKDIPENASFDQLLESTINWELDACDGTDQTEGSSFGFSSGNPDGYD